VAAGVPALQIDGNDLLVVREVVGEAVERARAGGGPTVIEALTYRLSDHTTSDDATRYRGNEEVEAARRREPVIRMRNFLQSRGLWDDAEERHLQLRCSEEIEAAVNQYLATPKQSTDTMFDHLYAQLPANLRAQREEARRYATPGH
jgi:2-oxoisovalerate dehydrogenase E1 component alpha subunit